MNRQKNEVTLKLTKQLFRVENPSALNQDGYPGLGKYYVQLREGKNDGTIVARVYGDTFEELKERIGLLNNRPIYVELADEES